jgi:hypothetical protein
MLQLLTCLHVAFLVECFNVLRGGPINAVEDGVCQWDISRVCGIMRSQMATQITQLLDSFQLGIDH